MGEVAVIQRRLVDVALREASLRSWYLSRGLKNEKEPALWIEGGDLQTEEMTSAKALGICKEAGLKNKLKADQGCSATNGAKTVILTATDTDPLTRGANLLEHVLCWPLF